MKIITIARKSLSERTVASNVLKHGCGALNVDASRIATPDGKPHFENKAQGVSLKSDWIGQGGMFSEDRKGTLSSASSLGRWPANTLLTHKSGCVLGGTLKVKPMNGSGVCYLDNNKTGSKIYVEFNQGNSRSDTASYVGSDGKEVIDKWICVEGCPAPLFPSSVAGRGVRNNKNPTGNGSTHGHMDPTLSYGHNDTGSAACFFKQFKVGE